MGCIGWPRPPIRPEDLPLIRELLTAEEYAALLKRLEVNSCAWDLPRVLQPDRWPGPVGSGSV